MNPRSDGALTLGPFPARFWASRAFPANGQMELKWKSPDRQRRIQAAKISLANGTTPIHTTATEAALGKHKSRLHARRTPCATLAPRKRACPPIILRSNDGRRSGRTAEPASGANAQETWLAMRISLLRIFKRSKNNAHLTHVTRLAFRREYVHALFLGREFDQASRMRL